MSSSNNMNVFSSSIVNTQDLAKSYLFQVIFEPESGTALAGILDKEELILKAKSATLPAKSFGELTTEYMGSKLVFPGKTTMDGEFTVKFDEFQDMRISQIFHKWQALIYNHGFEKDIAAQGITGGATSNYLKDYTCKIDVVLWDSELKNKLPIKYRFYFAYPKEVQAFEMDMEGDSKIQRSITFRYSTFECVAV